MCHAFRTPLNVIFGFSDMLEDPTFGAEERKAIVSRIRAAATELLGLVESQLSAAQVEAVRSVLASCLPANADEPSRKQPAITDAAAVLVVEDDSDVREAMIGVLEASGYPAVPAENGLAAFAALEAGLRPGVILLDLMV